MQHILWHRARYSSTPAALGLHSAAVCSGTDLPCQLGHLSLLAGKGGEHTEIRRSSLQQGGSSSVQQDLWHRARHSSACNVFHRPALAAWACILAGTVTNAGAACTEHSSHAGTRYSVTVAAAKKPGKKAGKEVNYRLGEAEDGWSTIAEAQNAAAARALFQVSFLAMSAFAPVCVRRCW